MKIILVCLSFYLIVNFISAFDTFNAQSYQQANNAPNIYHAASHLQGLAYQQQKAHSHNEAIPHQQAGIIDTKNNQVIQQNRPRFQRGKYKPQDHLQNTAIAQHQVNPIIDNQAIHPRFRPWFKTRTNLKNNIQLNQPRLANKKAMTNTTKSSGLLQILTAKSQTRGRISFAEYYFRQQLKAVFGHQHKKSPSPTHSNIKTGLR